MEIRVCHFLAQSVIKIFNILSTELYCSNVHFFVICRRPSVSFGTYRRVLSISEVNSIVCCSACTMSS